MSTPAQLRVRARDAIKRSGAAFVLFRDPQNYDATTSEAGGAPRQRWDGWAADWEYERSSDGSLVRTDDIRLIVAAEDLTDPKPGDIAEYAGAKLRVDTAGFIRKAGVVIAYDVRLVKG